MSVVGAFLWANRAALLFALLIGLAVVWHRDQVSDAVDVAKNELRTEAETKALHDVVAAQGSWIANTSLLTQFAAVDDVAMLQRLSSIDNALRSMKTEYRTHAIATPLSVDCFADPVRVQRVNDARSR